MKNLSVGIAVATAIGFMGGPLSAADLPVKAPPVAMPALYNWSGLYIGVEGGAVMGQNSTWQFLNASVNPIVVPTPLPVVPACTSSAGGLCPNVGHPLHGGFVGGEIGFNWQAPGNRWVFGFEGDGNWAELEEALTCDGVLGNGFTCGSKIRDFETVRARIGYAFGPTGNFLAYVTGGWATASLGAFEGKLSPPFGTVTDWRRVNGFAAGIGAEYGITPWLSLKGEVLYVGLEGKDFCFSNVGPVLTGTLNGGCTAATFFTLFPIFPAHVRDDFVLARMGLNARFWWGKAPARVVARY